MQNYEIKDALRTTLKDAQDLIKQIEAAIAFHIKNNNYMRVEQLQNIRESLFHFAETVRESLFHSAKTILATELANKSIQPPTLKI